MEKLYKILLSDVPSIEIENNKEYMFNIIPNLSKCVGFLQHNDWHVYDVYDHIMHVLDGVSNNLELRLAALFHDLGKVDTFVLDKNGVGHFPNHWVKSDDLFNEFSIKYNLDDKLVERVSKLIYYHDYNMSNLSYEERDNIINIFGDDISLLFELKRSDLLAQNSQYYYLLEEYIKQELSLVK